MNVFKKIKLIILKLFLMLIFNVFKNIFFKNSSIYFKITLRTVRYLC